MMPRERTNARLCGHMFWQAYHSPRLVKWKTAICTLPYLIAAPPFVRKVVDRCRPLTHCGLASRVVACRSWPFGLAGALSPGVERLRSA